MSKNQDLHSRIEELESVVSSLQQDNERLSQELELMYLRRFGPKTEKIDPRQMWLFDKSEIFGDSIPPHLKDESDEGERAEEKAIEKPGRKKGKKKKPGHGRSSFPSHLPRETVDLDVQDHEKVCPDCGKPMKPMGTDVCERAHVIPAQVVIRQYVKHKYGCPDGHAVVSGETPPSPVDRGKYEASFYAYIATSKFADHTPLHRLEGILKRQGLQVSRSTMWDLLERFDSLAGKPILDQMRHELLQERFIQADETPIRVILEGTKNTKSGYIWVYRSGDRICFDFTRGRERDGPVRFLGSWKGILQTDGYSGYNEVTRNNQLIRAGCWAHVRRKFKDALDLKVKEAEPPFRVIQRLFWIERAMKRRSEAKGLSQADALDLVRRVRERRSQRTLDKLSEAIRTAASKKIVVPKSPLGKAMTYLRNQEYELRTFLRHPEVPIHNNGSENALRPIALGRRNWLFVASEKGGHVASRFYSLINACKALSIDPFAYLTDILERIETTPASKIGSLTPWAWKRQMEDSQTSQD